MADQPRGWDFAKLTAYYNCQSLKEHPGYFRFPKSVLEVSLEEGGDAILAKCDESVRYKIRRAQRDGVTSDRECDEDAFVTFYNVFAATKDFSPLDRRHFSCHWPSITVTKAVHEGSVLAMHAYMVDAEASRATLLYSCSHFRNVEDSRQRNFLGNASRFLYWDDMRRFATQGLRTFDFGYFGSSGQLSQVNHFKMGYPCVEKPVSTYISWPMYLFRRLTQPNNPF